jgi:hypothetical protein
MEIPEFKIFLYLIPFIFRYKKEIANIKIQNIIRTSGENVFVVYTDNFIK